MRRKIYLYTAARRLGVYNRRQSSDRTMNGMIFAAWNGKDAFCQLLGLISRANQSSRVSHHGGVYLRHSVVETQLAKLQREVDELAGLLSNEVPHHVRVSFVRHTGGGRAGGRGLKSVRA